MSLADLVNWLIYAAGAGALVLAGALFAWLYDRVPQPLQAYLGDERVRSRIVPVLAALIAAGAAAVIPLAQGVAANPNASFVDAAIPMILGWLGARLART